MGHSENPGCVYIDELVLRDIAHDSLITKTDIRRLQIADKDGMNDALPDHIRIGPELEYILAYGMIMIPLLLKFPCV